MNICYPLLKPIFFLNSNKQLHIKFCTECKSLWLIINMMSSYHDKCHCILSFVAIYLPKFNLNDGGLEPPVPTLHGNPWISFIYMSKKLVMIFWVTGNLCFASSIYLSTLDDCIYNSNSFQDDIICWNFS